MNKRKRKQTYALILLLVITIGYALLSTTLKINGIAGIKSNLWDIHFTNVVPNKSSTIAAEKPTITENATKVSYEVELSLPGDFYEFTVDVVNEGTINGKITDVKRNIYPVIDGEVSTTTTTLPSYIHSTIYYDGTEIEPTAGDILEAEDSVTYRIRIEYDANSKVLASTDATYVIVDEITYTQTKDRNRNIEDIISEIEANPNNYRNQGQDVNNQDIGLDEDGNVINLNFWVEEVNLKDYKKKNQNEVILGERGIYTAATSAAQVVDGEVQTPIPAYIMFAGENKFLPVTEISWVFCNYYHESDVVITKVPHIPNTVKTIGDAFIHSQNIQEVIIPEYIEKIGDAAFGTNSISKLTFESDSNLKVIGDKAFRNNNLSGNLVLPQSVTSIGERAFASNSLTSVTFPTSATYFDSGNTSSFDSGVTINHQY